MFGSVLPRLKPAYRNDLSALVGKRFLRFGNPPKGVSVQKDLLKDFIDLLAPNALN